MRSRPIVIIYSRKDYESVHEHVVSRLGYAIAAKCCIEGARTIAGDVTKVPIHSRIDECETAIFALSHNVADSEQMRLLMEYAQRGGKTVIPVVIDDKGNLPWVAKVLGSSDFYDARQNDQISGLYCNLKAKYYGMLAKDYLAAHPKNPGIVVQCLNLNGFTEERRIIYLDEDEASKLKEHTRNGKAYISLDLVRRVVPEVYSRIRRGNENGIESIKEVDWNLFFAKCNVAVFENGMTHAPKFMSMPISISMEDYERLLAWKLSDRNRDIVSLQRDIPQLAEELIAQIRNGKYTPDSSCLRHSFMFDIEDLEQDVLDILGERKVESAICEGFQKELFQTTIQIFDQHLFFGIVHGNGCYGVEVEDIAHVQSAMQVSSYGEIRDRIKADFNGEFGVASFIGWLEKNGIEYDFIEGVGSEPM